MTSPDAEAMPLRRFSIDRLVESANGRSLPDDDELDEHLVALLDRTEQEIPRITFRRDNSGEAGRVHYKASGHLITYDPAARLDGGYTDAPSFRTSALLHEIMHVICDRDYEKPPRKGELDGYNLHIDPQADDARIGASIREQQQILYDNYVRALAKLEKDRSKVITAGMREHLKGRFDYGMRMSVVHYDSVLFELLVYLTLHGAQETPTFKHLRSLSAEAAERREDRPARRAVAVFA